MGKSKSKKQNSGVNNRDKLYVLSILRKINYVGLDSVEVAQLISNKSNFTKNRAMSVINALISDGILSTQGKRFVAHNDQKELTGTYHPGKGQFGYIIPTGGGQPLKTKSLPSAHLTNDAQVTYMITNKGDVVILKAQSVKNDPLVGIVDFDENGTLMFYPQQEGKFQRNPLIVLNSKNSEIVKNAIGKRVTVEVPLYQGGEDCCTIRNVFAEIGNPTSEFNAQADKAGVIMQRSVEAIKQLETIPTTVDLNTLNLTDENGTPKNPDTFDASKPSYVDLRDKMFCTIDPDDCKDMDDSVYTEIDENGNFVTYAAIADVTEYIKPNSPLWKEAQEQGFTLYVPGSAYDMLPHELAAGICSLNPNVDRLTMCVKSVVDPKTGKRIPEQTKVFHAVINSKRKFSYNEVQAELDRLGEAGLKYNYAKFKSNAQTHKTVFEPKTLTEAIILNKMVSDTLWKEFNGRNNLKLSPDKETKFIFNEDLTKVLSIEDKPHIPSMELIEALMINANECVAEYTLKNKINSLYRVHGEPNTFKVEKLKSYLSYCNIPFNGQVDNSSLQQVINASKNTPYEETVNFIIKRMLDRAEYSYVPHPTNEDGEILHEAKCHNALQSDAYSHFTSGIRRFSDLVAQYAIKQHLRGKGNYFSDEVVQNLGPHLVAREKAIEDADIKCNEIAGAMYMLNHINDIVDGKVSLISETRVVLETKENLHIEVPTLSFAGGEAKVKNDGFALVDAAGKEIFKLGDVTTVKICGADVSEGKIYANPDLQKTYTNQFALDAQTLPQHNKLLNQMQQRKK